jgi:CubicO group peptidase (beta-lactamase class C family)
MTLKVDVPAQLIRGDVDEGYGPVADAFRRNFADRGEVGAACAVYRDGTKVVDLWGGYRDGVIRAPWLQDTVVVMFSTTKGVSSLALALAHSRGLLDYDQPVATYWPEFAWRGKGEVTVRQLLSHQGGLPVVDIPLTVADLADLDVLAAALALQRPLWPAGTRHGYHGITLGWYEGELLRRVDPARRSLGRFFDDEIAAPHGIEFFIGLPAGFDPQRQATIHGRSKYESLLHIREVPRGMLLGMMRPGSLLLRSFSNPRELTVDTNYNRPDVLAVEIPAGNGIGEPRGVAAAYGAAVSGELGLSAATLEALVHPAQAPTGGPVDLLLGVPAVYSLGYLKPTADYPFGSSAGAAFGTPGNGGSFGFADPDTGIGYCYAPNRLGFGLSDPRDIALRDALYQQVLRERPQTLPE